MFKGYEDVTTLKTDKQHLTIKFVMKVWYELADSSFWESMVVFENVTH